MLVKNANKSTTQSSKKTNQWVKKALRVHSIISIAIARQLQSEKEITHSRKMLSRQALGFIDELDSLLENPLDHLKQYTEIYQALFLILNRLNLSESIQQTIIEKFGDRFLINPWELHDES